MNVIQKTLTTVIAVFVFCQNAFGQDAVDGFSAPDVVPKGQMMWLAVSGIVLAAIAFIAMSKSYRAKQD